MIVAVALTSLSGAQIIAGVRQPVPLRTSAPSAQAPERTVWDGIYTVEQAQRGGKAYERACSRCHRENLAGEAAVPPLIGAPFFDRWSNLSVHDLFFAIQITMSHSPDLFAPSEMVADVVSYLLRANGIPAGANELPVSQDELRHILITEPAAH